MKKVSMYFAACGKRLWRYLCWWEEMINMVEPDVTVQTSACTK